MLQSSVGVIRFCLLVCLQGMVEKFESVVTTIVWAPTAGAGTEETTLKLQIIGGPILEVTSQLGCIVRRGVAVAQSQHLKAGAIR